jgi:hypothetical protein
METALEPSDLTFDAYTLCSFVPDLGSARAIPLVVIGYREGRDPEFVWLVPKSGLDATGLTTDPYYAKILRDPHPYFHRKLGKYVAETGCVRRGIQMLIDCHQEHLSFTELRVLDARPLSAPLEVALVKT